MNKTTNHATSTDTQLDEREQSILDTALLESDQLLARSLHEDDQRRRRRKVWLLALVFGGVAMGSLLIAFMAGWLTLGQIQLTKAAGPTIQQVEQAETLSTEGWGLWQQRQFTLASEKFAAAVKIDPKATQAWNGLGWSYFNGGDSVKAVGAFEKCVALEPKHAAALNGLGQIYLMWEEYDRAEKYLLLAAPQASASWYGLSRLYLLQGKFAEAKPWVEKTVAQNPQDANAKKMLEAAQTGKLDDELKKMMKPAGKPSASTQDSARGWALFQQGKMRTAERLFRRALKVDSENLSALNGLAFCLLNQGNHQQAQPLFEKYLTKQKDTAGSMNGLARCLKASGKVSEAIAVWERMAKKYPGPTAAAVGLAETYLERKEYEKSAEYYQILVNSDAKNKRFVAGLQNAQAGLTKSP